jgi:hypothetical protein
MTRRRLLLGIAADAVACAWFFRQAVTHRGPLPIQVGAGQVSSVYLVLAAAALVTADQLIDVLVRTRGLRRGRNPKQSRYVERPMRASTLGPPPRVGSDPFRDPPRAPFEDKLIIPLRADRSVPVAVDLTAEPPRVLR